MHYLPFPSLLPPLALIRRLSYSVVIKGQLLHLLISTYSQYSMQKMADDLLLRVDLLLE